jgi:hypothetical protein
VHVAGDPIGSVAGDPIGSVAAPVASVGAASPPMTRDTHESRVPAAAAIERVER